jgi:sodium pump decarboxylase gamma subunit
MDANFVQSLLLLVVGMAVTFVVLSLLAGMIWLFKAVDEKINRRRISRYAERVESHKIEDEVNDEVVAVISAAVAAIMKSSVTIRRIHFLQSPEPAAWASSGRLSIMASHAISKRKT